MSGNRVSRGARLVSVALALGLVVTAGALALYASAPAGVSGVQGHAEAPRPAANAVTVVPGLPPNEVYGVEASVAVGPSPVGVAYDSANHYVYIANSQGDNVTVVNGATESVVTNVAVGANPAGIAYDSTTNSVYVVDSMQDSVSIISSGNTVSGNFTVPDEPTGIAYDSASGYLYITQQTSNSTAVYSPSTTGATLVTTLEVGLQPIAATYDSTNNEVYVANSNSSNVSIIDAAMNSVLGAIPVGDGPLAIAFDSGQNELFVANDLSNNTTIVSTASNEVVGSVTVGDQPDGAAYNPSLGIVAVADEGSGHSGQVSIILDSNNTVVATVQVGNGTDPVGVAWDSANGFEYVADANASKVTVVGTPTVPPYSVTFTETGLTAGASWTVSVAGVPKTSTSTSISFAEPNGSYAYTVTPIAGYVGTPLSGTVPVNGFPVNVAVTFTVVLYSITFTETGLASGTLWSVALNGTPANSATANVTFSEPNGSYTFAIPSVSGYSAAPTSGWSNVSGGAVSVDIAFTKNPGTGTSGLGSVGGVPLWEIAVIVAAIAAVVVGVLWSMRRSAPPATGSSGPPT
jgi:YVTN family beta-propeller protein